MNTFIPLEKLQEIDLQDYHEVWVTTSERWPQDPETAQRMCLWRADRELTTDVDIDDVYFQNLPRLWLRVDDLHDAAAISRVESAIESRTKVLNLEGEFHPPEVEKQPCEEKNTDLRS